MEKRTDLAVVDVTLPAAGTDGADGFRTLRSWLVGDDALCGRVHLAVASRPGSPMRCRAAMPPSWREDISPA